MKSLRGLGDAPPWTATAVAIALGALVLAQHSAWLGLHTALETWDDDAGLFRLALCFMGNADAPCSVGAPYPPLVPWVSSLLMGADVSLAAAMRSLWPFLALLVGALFVGVRHSMGTMAGLAAMALGPVMVWSLHIRGKYYTEVPLAALCVAAVVALALSDGLRRRWPSAAFGALLGLGLLTKWSFAFFMGPLTAAVMAGAVWGSIHHPVHRIVAAAGALAVPGFVLAGAAGWFSHGLTVGVWSALALVVFMVGAMRRWGGDGHRLANVGLMVAAVVALAGPWYWGHFWSLQEFLAANLSQKFHGDPVRGWMGWPFYPAVLLTRMMGTPTALLFVIGAAFSVRKSTPPLVRYALFALCSGTLILGVLPYRAGRYAVPVLGLVVPIVLWAVCQQKRVARVAVPLFLAGGLFHQASWVPMAVDGARVPHHWPVFSLPEADLMGNTKRGIYQAYVDLLRPRWRFLPVASPPIHRTTPSKRLVDRIAARTGDKPSLIVVVDPGSKLNLNAMQTHLASTRPPATTKVVRTDRSVSAASLALWAQRARKPRDQPATASGPPEPRRLFVVVAHRPDTGPLAAEIAVLRAAGLRAVNRDGVIGAFEPVGTTVWMAGQ